MPVKKNAISNSFPTGNSLNFILNDTKPKEGKMINCIEWFQFLSFLFSHFILWTIMSPWSELRIVFISQTNIWLHFRHRQNEKKNERMTKIKREKPASKNTFGKYFRYRSIEEKKKKKLALMTFDDKMSWSKLKKI